MDELARRLAAGPSTFPHSLDAANRLLLLVGLSEAAIVQASFLDQRVLTPSTWGRWIPLGDIAERLDRSSRDDAHYIFHIGHVGSTLLSRLVGEIDTVFALREPLILRDLAALARGGRSDADLVGLVRRLLARSFRSDQRAIIKATSFVSDIAADLVSSRARALLLSVPPVSYFTTILAGENSRRELDMLTPSRLDRLPARLGETGYAAASLGEGERLALAWLTETLALQAAADALPPGAALRVDFDDFLDRPVDGLRSIATHLDLPLPTDRARAIVAGPHMQRYSKAPEHRYSADLRRRLQEQARRDHADTIRRALDWLDEAKRRYAAVARASAAFGG